MEMALERVGLGAVFLAPNRRFIFQKRLSTWCLWKGGTGRVLSDGLLREVTG